jgi:hypothetical protein
LEQQFKKAKTPEDNNHKKKSIEKITDTKGQPAEQKPLYPCNNGIDPIGVMILYPTGIPGSPFDEYSEQDKQNPAPAFHKPVKQAGKKTLQKIIF